MAEATKPMLLLFSLQLQRYMPHDYDVPVEKLNPLKALCEVILDNTGRPCVDFDIDIESLIPHIEKAVTVYYERSTGKPVYCVWKKATDKTHTSWHLVVNGVYYEMCWVEECTKLARYLELVFKIQIDKGIYRRGGGLRLVGQCKPGGTRRLIGMSGPGYTQYLLHAGADDETLTVPLHVLEQQLQSMWDGRQGVTPSTRHTMRMVHPRYLPQFRGLVLRGYANGFYEYRRVAPWHCPICKRVHEHDNAYAYVSHKSTLRFKCRRTKDTSGDQYIEYTLPQEAIIDMSAYASYASSGAQTPGSDIGHATPVSAEEVQSRLASLLQS